MKKPELLAPAGSFEKAKIAFLYGADAVYAGTSKLSLRTRAEMDIESLKQTIEYAHNIGKKVYVAMNIYARDNDYQSIKEELIEVDRLGVDGIIIADGGIVEYAKKYAPNTEIHISTQANVVSLEDAKFWYKNGAKRVILSRELTGEEIRYIMDNKPSDLSVEMFIHGAICYAYSGRCYLSKYLANRCANLGDCAQPCRWEYKLFAEEVNKPGSIIEIDHDDKGTYIFSSKDMCLINKIPEIIDMGVDSLKIEGRLKTDYYLAKVVSSYRKAIDDYCDNKDNWDVKKYLSELEKVKTRGFSEFYYNSNVNQDIHDYDGQSENTNYEYAAKVIERQNDLIIVEIKNKLINGDKLEVLIPGEDSKVFIIGQLYDIKTGEEIDTINPGIQGQQVKLKIPFEVKENYIIRRLKK